MSSFGLAPRSRIRFVEAANIHDVMWEQFAYLLEHVEDRGLCGCSSCERYTLARALLMEPFEEPRKSSASTPKPGQRLTRPYEPSAPAAAVSNDTEPCYGGSAPIEEEPDDSELPF